MNLTGDQMRWIAELKGLAGYQLLLDCVQAHIDDLDDAMDMAGEDKKLLELARSRKSIRTVLHILKTVPEKLAQELGEGLIPTTPEEFTTPQYRQGPRRIPPLDVL